MKAPKNKKKMAKKALKELSENTYIIGKFRLIFQMYDYENKDVSRAIRLCVKRFIKESKKEDEAVAMPYFSKNPYADLLKSSGAYSEDDDEEDIEDEDDFDDIDPITEPRKSHKQNLKVNRKNNRADRFSKMFE